MEANTVAEKNWKIDMIEALPEGEARNMALETMQIKGHNIYFVDFGGHFGYSALVFMDGMHVHYANEYELHHRYNNPTRDDLRVKYMDYLNRKLFTDAEIIGHVRDYDEYTRKEYFLRNYYGMRRTHISIFCINPTPAQEAEFKRRTANMHYDPISFAYYEDQDFVLHHMELHIELTKAWSERENNADVMKDAFIREMFNHEYSINWDADFDTLSAFGNLHYVNKSNVTLDDYFDQLGFTDVQRKAYIEARREYYRRIGEPGGEQYHTQPADTE